MQELLDHDDPYTILEVHPTASTEEIRLAYRKLVMSWHPDRNSRADAAEKFKRIRFAYELLRDSQRRAEYDRHTAARSHASSPACPADAAPDVPTRADVRRRVRITLDQQLRGGHVELQLTRTEYCDACTGSGSAGTVVSCGACGGSGHVRSSLGLFPFFLGLPTTCADCAGEGLTPAKCAVCDGKGTTARKRGRLRFEVPPGLPPGGTLRIRGHGRRSRSGRASGDLLIQIAIDAHPLFEPDFPHLRCEMPVSVFRALAGGALEVPTLGAPVSVPLPAQLIDGTQLRVDGRGMLNGVTGKRGDLLVKLRLVRPHKLSDRQRDLLAQLERLTADDPAYADWKRVLAAHRAKRPTGRE